MGQTKTNKRTVNKKYQQKSKRTRRNKHSLRKTTRNRKGGLLFNQSINLGGIDLSRQTGQKRYNWKTGKWDNMVCYGIGALKGCRIVPAK